MAAVTKKINAWSYSRYRTYQQCPLKAKLTILDRLEEPKSSAMLRGQDLHERIAGYLRGTERMAKSIAPLKQVLAPLRANFKAVKKLQARGMAPQAEEQWAWTAKWTQTEWRDWAGAWVRVALDVMWWVDEDTVRVRDWKSGRMSEKEVAEYLEQLELYALAVLLRYEHCQRVVPDLFFIDAQASYPPALDLVFTRADIPRLKKTWAMRVKRMLSDTRFPARPGWYCPGCYFNHGTEMGWKEKTAKPAGPCKY